MIGVPDAEKGEVVRAFIVKKPGQDVDAAEFAAAADVAHQTSKSTLGPKHVL